MSSTPPPSPETRPGPGPIHPISPLAAFLSYLVPGLGQVYQGRVGKGVLFLACIYVLFFYGNALGSGTAKVGDTTYQVGGAVYLPDVYALRADPGFAQAQDLQPGEDGPPAPKKPGRNPFSLDRLSTNLYNRPQFLG